MSVCSRNVTGTIGDEMEELLRLVAALRRRLDEHATALRGNEALTRYALIDPLLRCLGWDTEDPSQVVPEYGIPSNPKKAADYALFAHGARGEGNVPKVIVEAKKLGLPLADAAQQAVNYCAVDGFEYFVVTDGSDWQLFGMHRKGNLDAKRIMRFDLRSDPLAEVCRKALALWRQGFDEDAVQVAPGHGEATDGAKSSAVPHVSSQPSAASTGTGEPKIKAPASVAVADWVPLSTLVPERGISPAELRTPSGDVVVVGSWRRLMVEVAKWLVATGKLSTASEPLRAGQRYVLAPMAKHPDGSHFKATGDAGGVYVELHHSARSAVRHARSIAGHAGVDAGLFAVRVRKQRKLTTS